MGGDAVLIDCVFSGNTANMYAGGMETGGRSLLVNCVFAGNSGEDGGGLHIGGDNPVLVNCLFIGNTASRDGGGLFNYRGFAELINCTFYGNSADDDGGGVYVYHDAVLIDNSILWGNTDSGPTDESAQLFVESMALVNHSCIQGWTGDLGGVGNIDQDPSFVDADGADGIPGTDDDNLRLLFDSPCINTGDPDFATDPDATDLDGHPRILCTRVDMGAYEFGIGDYDCDRDVDLIDFASWPYCFTGPDGGPFGSGCEAFDFNADVDVDFADFAGFQVTFVDSE